jgi:hypothetical protein
VSCPTCHQVSHLAHQSSTTLTQTRPGTRRQPTDPQSSCHYSQRRTEPVAQSRHHIGPISAVGNPCSSHPPAPRHEPPNHRHRNDESTAPVPILSRSDCQERCVPCMTPAVPLAPLFVAFAISCFLGSHTLFPERRLQHEYWCATRRRWGAPAAASLRVRRTGRLRLVWLAQAAEETARAREKGVRARIELGPPDAVASLAQALREVLLALCPILLKAN